MKSSVIVLGATIMPVAMEMATSSNQLADVIIL